MKKIDNKKAHTKSAGPKIMKTTPVYDYLIIYYHFYLQPIFCTIE